MTGYSKRPGRTHECIVRDILDSVRPETLEALMHLQPRKGMDAQESMCRFEKMVSEIKQHEADRTLFKDGSE